MPARCQAAWDTERQRGGASSASERSLSESRPCLLPAASHTLGQTVSLCASVSSSIKCKWIADLMEVLKSERRQNLQGPAQGLVTQTVARAGLWTTPESSDCSALAVLCQTTPSGPSVTGFYSFSTSKLGVCLTLFPSARGLAPSHELDWRMRGQDTEMWPRPPCYLLSSLGTVVGGCLSPSPGEVHPCPGPILVRMG